MPIEYSDDTLTLGGDVKVEEINEDLFTRELGRPLVATRTAGDRQVVTVDGRRAGEVHRTLTEARPQDDVRRDPLVHIGTYELLGKNAPHAATHPHALPDGKDAPHWAMQLAGTRRPVIAVLDSGVHAGHPWLPQTSSGDPFLIDATQVPDHPWPAPAAPPADHPDAGHGTFIAGLIRQKAPDARVLSVRIMGPAGKINESTVIDALRWVRQYRTAETPVDLVCMAFGRAPGDDTDRLALAQLGFAIFETVQDGIRVIASAGNDGGEKEIFPAALETVTAVGAGTAEHPAGFSNHGPWVDRFVGGVDEVSILPPDRWATWSGTSFSAALHVAELSRADVV